MSRRNSKSKPRPHNEPVKLVRDVKGPADLKIGRNLAHNVNAPTNDEPQEPKVERIRPVVPATIIDPLKLGLRKKRGSLDAKKTKPEESQEAERQSEGKPPPPPPPPPLPPPPPPPVVPITKPAENVAHVKKPGKPRSRSSNVSKPRSNTSKGKKVHPLKGTPAQDKLPTQPAPKNIQLMHPQVPDETNPMIIDPRASKKTLTYVKVPRRHSTAPTLTVPSHFVEPVVEKSEPPPAPNYPVRKDSKKEKETIGKPETETHAKPEKPAEKPRKSQEQPRKSQDQPHKSEEPTQKTHKPEKPTEKAQKHEKPTEKVQKPEKSSEKPSQNPLKPTEKSQKPEKPSKAEEIMPVPSDVYRKKPVTLAQIVKDIATQRKIIAAQMSDEVKKLDKEEKALHNLPRFKIPQQEILLGKLQDQDHGDYDFGGFLRLYYSPVLRNYIAQNWCNNYRGTKLHSNWARGVDLSRIGTKPEEEAFQMRHKFDAKLKNIDPLRAVSRDDFHFEFLKELATNQSITIPIPIIHIMIREVMPVVEEAYQYYFRMAGPTHHYTAAAADTYAKLKNRLKMYDNM